MKVRVHYEINSVNDYYDLTGESEYDIVMKNVAQMYKRNLDAEKNNCWAEQLDYEEDSNCD